MGSGSHLCVGEASAFASRLGRWMFAKGSGSVSHGQIRYSRAAYPPGSQTCALQETLADSAISFRPSRPLSRQGRGPKQG